MLGYVAMKVGWLVRLPIGKEENCCEIREVVAAREEGREDVDDSQKNT